MKYYLQFCKSEKAVISELNASSNKVFHVFGISLNAFNKLMRLLLSQRETDTTLFEINKLPCTRSFLQATNCFSNFRASLNLRLFISFLFFYYSYSRSFERTKNMKLSNPLRNKYKRYLIRDTVGVSWAFRAYICRALSRSFLTYVEMKLNKLIEGIFDEGFYFLQIYYYRNFIW